ncbi:DUF2007 domain-containing protein [Reichenbachiella versicolor]|uniref:DUF2007 domain-containing protein n=1 Tax=Reichenbachiella versicolor TaxID=1821036 RepID=UPI000D6E8D03|nr:DUF2007 domain-containing protein [Reichenbachiella versicolor]
MKDWQKVFDDKMEYRAEIVVAVLEDSGLQPVMINKQDTSYQFGHFEVHVPADNVIRAIKIIKDDINFD